MLAAVASVLTFSRDVRLTGRATASLGIITSRRLLMVTLHEFLLTRLYTE